MIARGAYFTERHVAYAQLIVRLASDRPTAPMAIQELVRRLGEVSGDDIDSRQIMAMVDVGYFGRTDSGVFVSREMLTPIAVRLCEGLILGRFQSDAHPFYLRFGSLLEFHRFYRSGDRRALMTALMWCMRNGWAIPAWIKRAMLKADALNPKSWDEALGSPTPKGQHHHRLTREKMVSFILYSKIEKLRKDRRPVGQGLFEEVGKKFGMSGSLARNLYYKEKKSLKRIENRIAWANDAFREEQRERR